MEISVVVPTFNRGNNLKHLLESLASQTYKNFEVIIIDDGSELKYQNELEVLITEFDNHLNIYYHHTANQGRGLARQTGVQVASNELIVFYDDDIRANPDSLKYHVDFHTIYPGCILDGPALYDMALIPDDFQFWRATRENSWYTKADKPIKKQKASLTGANKSFTKSTFDKIGGFRNLQDAEDFDFAFRAMHEYGIDLYQDYRTWVFHDDFKNIDQYLIRRVEAMKAGKSLYLENPKIIETYPERWVFRSENYKGIVGWFKNDSLVKFTKTKAFAMLPVSVRFKVYEYIVVAYSYYQ
jgi:glycosyltransferase involved in cell wall biosynthesis